MHEVCQLFWMASSASLSEPSIWLSHRFEIAPIFPQACPPPCRSMGIRNVSFMNVYFPLPIIFVADGFSPCGRTFSPGWRCDVFSTFFHVAPQRTVREKLRAEGRTIKRKFSAVFEVFELFLQGTCRPFLLSNTELSLM